MFSKIKNTLGNLGPGLLYAGAAVGVSHLVWSTKAGATYGFLFLALIPIIHFIKYPFYQYGPRYTAATGKNILHGYNDLGKWALWVYIIMTIGTMCIIQAAVTVVTSGIAIKFFGLQEYGIDIKHLAFFILIITQFLLISGHYTLLDKLMKFIIIFLTVTTIIAVVSILIKSPGGMHEGTNDFTLTELTHAMFLAGFLGWMPAPLDISVWHSVWSEDSNTANGEKASMKKAKLDFNVGFIGTACLAICFLSLGALVMYGGVKPSSSGVGFAGQLIKMYTDALGSWAYYLIGIAALTTMFSTTLTCLDAYPRTLQKSYEVLRGKPDTNRNVYNTVLGITLIGTGIIFLFFMGNMLGMIIVATVVSFVSAPVLALINFLVMKGATVPEEHKPGKIMRIWSWSGIIILSFFSLWYIWTAFIKKEPLVKVESTKTTIEAPLEKPSKN